MFRKAFIRFIVVMMLASASLLALAVTRQLSTAKDAASCECLTESTGKSASGEFLILESIGRMLIQSRTYQ